MKKISKFEQQEVKNKRKLEARERLYRASILGQDELLTELGTTRQGISSEDVEIHRAYFGSNEVQHGEKKSIFAQLVEAFVDPFTLVLAVLAIVSFITDVLMAVPGEKNPLTVIIIVVMVLISGGLKFVQESRSGQAAERLIEMIETTTNVQRSDVGPDEIPLDDVVVGDIVYLAAGDMIPADMRILACKDLFVSQAALTGESEATEKESYATPEVEANNLTDSINLAFMGTTVLTGSGIGVVAAVGEETVFGATAQRITEEEPETSFERGINAVSWLLIRFMLIMVPIVFLLNGFSNKNWMDAFLFAISIAVGLTPEMLPMIVTTCLAKGAVTMASKKTIIKKLNSMQNFGAMDILCTDKTGTLTQDRVVLEYHLDVSGVEDPRVLRHAFLNSYFQTGLKNLLDVAIIHATHEESEEYGWGNLSERYEKVDEVPFDFERRRMSVVVQDHEGKAQMITKGAVEEMLGICTHVEHEGAVKLLTDELRKELMVTVDDLNDDGLRVLAVAQKTNPSPVDEFSVNDECDMVLIGYLAFLDPPKESTMEAIRTLEAYGVGVKVLTGDNARVTRSICRQVGISVEILLLGTDIDKLSDEELALAVETVDVFAKLSPEQKVRVVESLQSNGHTVGHMGDGINDAPAMRVADVGISVDNAVDIAKESADIILLEKDLMVLEEGILEGRKTYANMIKYIKMTASSNFGNVFSVLVASAFLPFLPMTSIQLILLNLIYDISCIAMPWDNVDEEMIQQPRSWDASQIGSFMIWLGPTSSIFDIATYLLMYYVIAPQMCGGLQFKQIADPAMKSYFMSVFQAGWFIESMWTQTLVIHMLRTEKIPFIQSVASFPVIVLTMTGIISLTVIPFTGFGKMIGLAALPATYFIWLGMTVVAYMVLVTIVKRIYVKRYKTLL